MSVWINEFHYDNFSTDSGEFIEIGATAGTDLTGWSLVRYNGANGAMYTSPGSLPTLSGVVADQTGSGFGFVSHALPQDGLQNGSPDGLALVDPQGHVVQFLSYEGVFTATSGPAAGMTSVDIGVLEDGTKTGGSVGLAGSGSDPSQLHWVVETTATPGAVNTDESLGGSTPAKPSISVGDVTVTEGDDGTTTATFTVTRTGGADAFSVNYATADGTATAGSDYAATSGTLSFAAGEASKTISVVVNGDKTIEADETFTLKLSDPTNGAVISHDTASGTIVNDDAGAPAAGTPFINEFHYDNASTDTGEFIEVAGPAGLNLSGYSLVLYNGHDGTSYNTIDLTGTVADQQNGFGVASFALPVNGLQNGGSGTAPEADGIALVGPGGKVVEFISYEGQFTATNGPAAGLTSTDVGVSEGGSQSGTSIARTGTGVDPADFTWTVGGDSHGAVNSGETFLSPSPRLHVSDASVTEGDAGTSLLSFTVTRSGTDAAFSVDYATHDGTASAGSDYDAASGTLSFAAGEMSKTVTVAVHGDGTLEGDETLTLDLSNPTGGAQVIDGRGVGSIKNDDTALVHTYDIQGAGHASPLLGTTVSTEGVVTAVDTTGSRGFWIQDPTGDGDARTSDAVFVFTNSAPTLHVGDMVHVSGTVDEFQGSDTNNLSITEVSTSNSAISVLSSGNTIAPTVIGGPDGLHPPTEAIDSDHFATFNPDQDGIDFYESLEGMLVTIKNVQAVDSTFSNETFVVPDNGVGASGMNDRGGITISATDMNPEKIELFADSGVSSVTFNTVAGDHLGDVTGVVSYFGGNYEILPISAGATGTAGQGGQAPRETTTLAGDADHLTIGAYNVENLDPGDGDAKFAELGRDIAQNLGAPDIVGLEEIQDADGAGNGSDLSGAATLNKLIQAIEAAGGPHYQYVEIAPTANNSTGGESNGNIRQAFLYNPDRVDYVEGSAHQISDDDPTNGDAYNNSRKPLVADFQFHGQTVTAIDVHNYSRGGSDELFGLDQPPVNAGDQRRIDQTAPVERYVQGVEQADPQAHVVVMGDFNGFQFETAQTQLETGEILSNLTNLLAPTDRYSYIFEGNMEQIDQLYASPALQNGAQFDIVHLNTGQADRPTDHDPIVSRLLINTAPVGAADSYAGQEDVALTADAAHGVLANDTDADHDALTAVLVHGPQHGTLTLNADGSFSYQAAANYNGADSFTYVAHDASGAATASQTVDLHIAPVNDAPVAADDAAAVVADQSVTIDVLANDSDVDQGDTTTLVSVSASQLGGHVSTVDGKVVYTADGHATDLLQPGASVTDSFTYTVEDADHAASTATVKVTVTGAPLGHAQSGGNGDDTLSGTASNEVITGGNGDDRLAGQGGADSLDGGNGNDTATGGAGIDTVTGGNGDDSLGGGAGFDVLNGANGNDTLIGGAGDDHLAGGDGNDRFVFSGDFGHDTIADFAKGDVIQLDKSQFANFAAVVGHADQGQLGVTISLDDEHSILLAGAKLSSLSASEFLFA